MRGLESIVPPPELCDEIPEGCFADSALIGIYSDGEWIVLPRSKELEAITHVPAPTLQEIMEALPRSICADGQKHYLGQLSDTESSRWMIRYCAPSFYGLAVLRGLCAIDATPATAALQLWLQLHEAGMIPQKGEE